MIIFLFYEFLVYFGFIFKYDDHFVDINWFTHSHSRELIDSIVCHTHTFENKLGIKREITKYLKESCCLASD